MQEKHLQSATARQGLQGREVRGAEEENLVLLVSRVLRALLVQKVIRENKAIRDLGVTKDRLGRQALQVPQAQEGLLGTQGKTAPAECQECPVNQGSQENKA